MNVRELIDALKDLNPEAKVGMVWDGANRTDVDVVYMSRSGEVCLSWFGQTVYETEDRPVHAPTREQEQYWKTSEPEHSPDCGCYYCD